MFEVFAIRNILNERNIYFENQSIIFRIIFFRITRFSSKYNIVHSSSTISSQLRTRLLSEYLKSSVAFSQEQEKEWKTLIEYLKVLMDITSDEIGLHSTERNDNFLIMSYDKKATLIIVFQANEHIISWKTFFFFFLV